MILVLPRTKYDKVIEFDVMRKEVKEQKDRGNTSHAIYQQYHTASIALQKELLNEFKREKNSNWKPMVLINLIPSR